MEQVPVAIAERNWVFLREQDIFADAFQALVSAIDTDLPYVKMHTRLLTRALEWEGKDRNDDYLLRGQDLEGAQAWLAQTIAKVPACTELQRNYILKSEQAQIAHDRVIAAGKKARRMVQVGSAILGATLVAASIIGGLTIQALKQLEVAKLATRLEREGNTVGFSLPGGDINDQ
jgi:hypothetical protein